MRDLVFPANDTDPYERTIDHITLSVTKVTKVYTLLTVTIDQQISFSVSKQICYLMENCNIVYKLFIQSLKHCYTEQIKKTYKFIFTD